MVPLGMPRLSPRMQSTAFFMFGEDPETGERKACGTGSLIGLNHPDFDPQQQFTGDAYAVTAAHVVRGGGSLIRLNTKDGGHRFLEFDPAEWTFSDTDDLAAVDVTDLLRDQDEAVIIHDTWLAEQPILKHYQIGLGEDGFMLGLFSNLVGTNRNAVTGRFGNVSLLARSDAPIEYGGGIRPAHLFDMKSRPGFSGSPVFIYRTPSNDLRLIDQGPRVPMPSPSDGLGDGDHFREMQTYWRDRENTFVKLLGVHVAQYTDTVKAWRDRTVMHEVSEFIRDGDTLRVPNSMSVVATAASIRTLLDHASLAARRHQRDTVPSAWSEQMLVERTIYSGWLPNRGF